MLKTIVSHSTQFILLYTIMTTKHLTRRIQAISKNALNWSYQSGGATGISS